MAGGIKTNRNNRSGSSSIWTSEQTQELEKLLRLQKIASHNGFSCSPVFPKTLSDYLQLKADIVAEEVQAERKRMEAMIERTTMTEHAQEKIPNIGNLMNGRAFSDNRSLVLAEDTVWSPNFGQSSWPEPAAFHKYGHQRMERGLQRVMPPIAEVCADNELMTGKTSFTQEWWTEDGLRQIRRNFSPWTHLGHYSPVGWNFDENELRKLGCWNELLIEIDGGEGKTPFILE